LGQCKSYEENEVLRGQLQITLKIENNCWNTKITFDFFAIFSLQVPVAGSDTLI
jgi:hypothetical protein